jgi:hypothetical protein
MNRTIANDPGSRRVAGLRATAPYRLPVSGTHIYLRPFAGYEDLMLLEASALDMVLAIDLLESVVVRSDGYALDWQACPGTDIDAALLHLRRSVFGDRISSDIECPGSGCGRRIEVEFGIDEFLAHHAPHPARTVNVAASDEPGWYCLAEEGVTFRLPTGGDIVAAATERDAEKKLIQTCIRSEGLKASMVRRVLGIIESMAPSLSGELRGRCAECGAEVGIYFDARGFTLRELHDQAAFLYEDTCILAHHYHWTEADILALPSSRRIRYVETLKQHRGPA